MSPEPHYLPGPYPGLNNCDYYNLVRVYTLVAQARIALMQGQLPAAEVGPGSLRVPAGLQHPHVVPAADTGPPETLFNGTNCNMHGCRQWYWYAAASFLV